MAKRDSYRRDALHTSMGPGVRVKGTARQVCEKYETLAKDARFSDDPSLQETYLQHAEHWRRVVSEECIPR